VDRQVGRADALTGIAAVLLLVVGFGLPGAPPKADDSALKITHFFVDHRGSILAGMLLVGLSQAFFVWWVGTLRRYLVGAAREDDGLADVAFGGGLVGAALTLAGSALLAAAVFKVAKLGNLTVNRALFDLSGNVFVIGGFVFAVLIDAASISGMRSGALPGWLTGLGFVAALLQLVSCAALVVSSGFFAAGGAFGLIAILVSAVWIVAVSVVMMRGAGRAAAPAA
jgi:hypothetical protein